MSAHGSFTWYDLMTTDPEAAKGFYGELIGWRTQAWEGPSPYSMWTHEGAPLGGIMELPEEARAAGAPPHWLAYVSVDSVDATVAKVEELGGAVFVPGQDIPGTGRFAVFADPQGGVFAVYRDASETPKSDEAPGVGQFSWHELMSDEPDEALEFYSSLFGWVKSDAMDMGEMGLYQMYSLAEGTPPLGGIFKTPPEMPTCWLLYIRIDDVEGSIGKVTELGGQVLNGPMEVPGGDKIAQCMDPQGTAFALHSTAS